MYCSASLYVDVGSGDRNFIVFSLPYDYVNSTTGTVYSSLRGIHEILANYLDSSNKCAWYLGGAMTTSGYPRGTIIYEIA